MLIVLYFMNFYIRFNIVNIMVFYFVKVDVFFGWFLGMLLSDVLRFCFLNND